MKTIAILILLALCSCSRFDVEDKKYQIRSEGYEYYTNEYKMNGNCVSFQYECGCGELKENKVTLCGSYSIKQIKQ